jgi:hypothetical protein
MSDLSKLDVDDIPVFVQPKSLKPIKASKSRSKQQQMIALLKRPEGASIAELMEATGWQQHTVRGAMSGTLKKRLGLQIESVKSEGADRTYRILKSPGE